MPIFDLFSKRQKKLRGEKPDVLQYTDIPQTFRVQVVQMLLEGIGRTEYLGDTAHTIYQRIRDILCKEYGVFYLSQSFARNRKYYEEISDFILTADTEQVLDTIEISFCFIDKVCRHPNYRY